MARDVRWGKVSREAAAADYGVVIAGRADDPAVDGEASGVLRDDMPGTRPLKIL